MRARSGTKYYCLRNVDKRVLEASLRGMESDERDVVVSAISSARSLILCRLNEKRECKRWTGTLHDAKDGERGRVV